MILDTFNGLGNYLTSEVEGKVLSYTREEERDVAWEERYPDLPVYRFVELQLPSGSVKEVGFEIGEFIPKVGEYISGKKSGMLFQMNNQDTLIEIESVQPRTTRMPCVVERAVRYFNNHSAPESSYEMK